MPDFAYTARQASGQQVTGLISASNKQDALSSLASQNLFPVKIDVADEARIEQQKAQGRVRSRLLVNFYSQFADLLKSGVPLMRSLELMERQSSNAAMKGVLSQLRDRVADGSTLADAMKHHPKAFNTLVVSMVHAGEEGGFLEDVFKRVATFTEHQEEIKGRVQGAMIYPAMLLSVGLIIVVGMLLWIVPRFEPIFDRMRETGQLPLATKVLLGSADFIQSYWIFIIVGIGVAVYFGRDWLGTEAGLRQFDRFRLKAPLLGRIDRSLSISRFCRMLGTMLANGVPILQCLRIARDASGNVVLSEAIGNATENLTSGKSLAQPLSQSGEFPPEIVEMIAVGEESNNLENVLIDIAENLERRTNREIDIAVRLLEPLLLLVMGIAVLFIALGLLLPILQSSSIV